MKYKYAAGRREAEVGQKLKSKTWNGYYLDIQYNNAWIDKGTLSSVRDQLKSNREKFSFLGPKCIRRSQQTVLSFLSTQPTRVFPWHHLENHGSNQLVKLLGIVFLDGSGMGAHWELLTSFVFPDPSKQARLLFKCGFTQTFLLPTNAARINCSVMLTQIQTVSV